MAAADTRSEYEKRLADGRIKTLGDIGNTGIINYGDYYVPGDLEYGSTPDNQAQQPYTPYEKEISLQDNPLEYSIESNIKKGGLDYDPLDIFGGRAAKNAAAMAANAEQRAISEQGRQFDITQGQYEPYRQAGIGALGEYEKMLQMYGDYNVPSNLPGAFQSSTGIPGAYDFQSGDYFGGIQNNVPQGFKFGQEEFDQYKNPGYEFNKEEELRALDRNLAARGKRKAGVRGRALLETGQNLANQEWNAARGRALGDYNANVSREADIYGRSVDQFGRNILREADLYGRGYNDYADRVNRESTLYNRDLRDYASLVGREGETYSRGLEDYARLYVDPMNQYGQLAGQGQATALGLGGLRSSYANNINQGYSNIGDYNAASRLAQGQAQGQALNTVGNIAGQWWGSRNQSGIQGVNRGSQQDQMLSEQW